MKEAAATTAITVDYLLVGKINIPKELPALQKLVTSDTAFPRERDNARRSQSTHFKTFKFMYHRTPSFKVGMGSNTIQCPMPGPRNFC